MNADLKTTPLVTRNRPNLTKMLTVISVIGAILFLVHVAQDMTYGIEPGDLNDLTGGTAIVALWLYGVLVFRGMLGGYIVALISGVFSVLVPYIHMRGVGIGEIAKSAGGFWFASTLLLEAVAGVLSAMLAVHAAANRRRTKPIE
jgi:hypothetical protein